MVTRAGKSPTEPLTHPCITNATVSYGQDEPDDTFYEPEEVVEDFAPDGEVDEDEIEARAAAENGEDKVVVSGDPNQVQKPSSDADKKIPDNKRTTTPYLTKYERARVLGTRALQLR
jgi:DNA-directed RNA polymerase I, II, and III subunit RPABC2